VSNSLLIHLEGNIMAGSDLTITDVRLLNLRVTQEIGALEPAWDLGGQCPSASAVAQPPKFTPPGV
jgi:hypothetical protein